MLLAGSEARPQIQPAEALRRQFNLPAADPVPARGARGTRRGGAGSATLVRGQEKERGEHSDSLVPKELLCGLTGNLMRDPWIAADGCSYERQAIKQWFRVCVCLCVCVCVCSC